MTRPEEPSMEELADAVIGAIQNGAVLDYKDRMRCRNTAIADLITLIRRIVREEGK